MNKIEELAYQILVDHNAIYESPVDNNGELIGPLVGYAGTYKDENEEEKHYVGSAYFNMARVEEDPYTRHELSRILAHKIADRNILTSSSILVAAPMGGIIFATSTADQLTKRVAFFEKKDSGLVFARHILNENDNVFLMEDLCNNFSTTDKMIYIVNSKGAKVVGIGCIYNRSPYDNWKGIPVISVIHKPAPEYKQDDPVVKKLIEKYNIVWKPKEEWPFLKREMEKGRKKN